MKRFVFVIILAVVLLIAEQAGANLITNGDFETGTLLGWDTFTTLSGTLGFGFPDVVLFDTNDDGTATNSAQLRVGRTFGSGSGEGGGIFQSITTAVGNLTLSADIAVFDDVFSGDAEGGLFEMLFDGVIVDSHDFGFVVIGVAEFSMLANISNVTAGTHEVRLRMTRGLVSDFAAPKQYIDNVLATQVVIPEPGTLVLFGISILGILGYGYHHRKKAA